MHILHGGNALRRCEVAHPAAVFLLPLQGAAAYASEVPCNIREQPSAIGLTGRKNKTGLSGFFPDNLAEFRQLLQGCGIPGKTVLRHEAGFAEQRNVDVHAEHVSIPGQAVDAAIFV